MTETTTSQGVCSQVLTDALGLIPFVPPLIQAIGLFGLEPRLRELAALAVARAAGCLGVVTLHQAIGRAAGLTRAERAGAIDGLTAAERAALSLALATVGQPPPAAESTPAHPDQHFTSEQIRQLQAVALAVDLDCKLRRTAASLLHR